ncbi:MAG TPA: nucleotidyltransferase [Candidatus Altiarchaeales archaeon]|nr:nucleotidyltransferase [Candidatus Altiarchaeales archaeon]
MNLTKEEILRKIRENMGEIKKFGVKRIGIFGSTARNEITEKSDIDFVVEFERGKATFKNVCSLVDFLENLFGKEIDILTPDGIESIRIKHIREEIRRDIEYA